MEFFNPEDFDSLASGIAANLITRLIEKDEVVIGLLYERNGEESTEPLYPGMKPTSAYICYDEFNVNTPLRIKYGRDGEFVLAQTVENAEGDLITFSYVFLGEESKVVPMKLQLAMKKALATGNFLKIECKN